MISQPNLPEILIPKCMDILVKIANSERDLIRVVVDVVSELREGQGDEEIDAVCLPHHHLWLVLTMSPPPATCRPQAAPFAAEQW